MNITDNVVVEQRDADNEGWREACVEMVYESRPVEISKSGGSPARERLLLS